MPLTLLTLSYFICLRIVSNEKALNLYDFDAGQLAGWLSVAEQQAAVVDRWFINKTDAKCNPFTYGGSLGNQNNFASFLDCDQHKIFTPEEQTKACQEEPSVGACATIGPHVKEKWYYSNADTACISFQYSGCGGNANNFLTPNDCKFACQHAKNGGETPAEHVKKLISVPNEFDCRFTSIVKTESRKVGYIPIVKEKRCAYQVIDRDADRGFFHSLPQCVSMCIVDKVDACSSQEPHQIELPDSEILTNVERTINFYYFDHHFNHCIPFWSLHPTDNTIVDSGTHNIFSSVEYCASYCPAFSNIGRIQTNDPCTLKKIGVSITTDVYQIKRFFYNTDSGECESFNSNGKYLNLNNFKSKLACEQICNTP